MAAPQRWWQYAINNGGLYWISINGFHVNGVEDGFGIKTLPSYYYLIYWPAYDPGNNDLFAPVFINAAGNGLELLYGAAPILHNLLPMVVLYSHYWGIMVLIHQQDRPV